MCRSLLACNKLNLAGGGKPLPYKMTCSQNYTTLEKPKIVGRGLSPQGRGIRKPKGRQGRRPQSFLITSRRTR